MRLDCDNILGLMRRIILALVLGKIEYIPQRAGYLKGYGTEWDLITYITEIFRAFASAVKIIDFYERNALE